VPRADTAYVHRGVTTLLRPTTVWPNGETAMGDELNAWTDAVIETLKPVTLAESYQNFPNRMIEDWEQLYFGENYARLVDVKTKYDPDNLFNNPQSVQPRH
jgi:FAD/FMN-containing dehydrogenase